MEKKDKKTSPSDQVWSGVRIAGGWILIFGWFILVGAGTGLATSEAQHSELLGWMCLTIALFIAIATVDQWVRRLPDLLGLAILNAAFAVWNGYTGTNPSRRLDRLWRYSTTVAGGLSCHSEYSSFAEIDIH
jgi:hypothetical protein